MSKKILNDLKKRKSMRIRRYFLRERGLQRLKLAIHAEFEAFERETSRVQKFESGGVVSKSETVVTKKDHDFAIWMKKFSELKQRN